MVDRVEDEVEACRPAPVDAGLAGPRALGYPLDGQGGITDGGEFLHDGRMDGLDQGVAPAPGGPAGLGRRNCHGLHNKERLRILQ